MDKSTYLLIVILILCVLLLVYYSSSENFATYRIRPLMDPQAIMYNMDGFHPKQTSGEYLA